MCLVCSSVLLSGMETSHLHLLASLLLTGGKGADLVICGNVVLNMLSARSTSMLLRLDQISTLYLDVVAARSDLHQLSVKPAGLWHSRTLLCERLRFPYVQLSGMFNVLLISVR